MKKIFNILLTAVICLAGLAACTYDYPVAPMATTVTVAPNAANAVPAAGQSYDANVTADGAWVVSAPAWITVTPASGTRDQAVKITVAPNDGGERTGKVGFYSAVGDVGCTTIDLESTPLSEFTITQAADPNQTGPGTGDGTVISIKDYLALGANTDPYIITGTITRVVNTNYGNFDLTDETGTIYVYGLLNEALEAQKCWKDKGLAQGDQLTIKANEMKLYSGTWEIVNAVYVSHQKSLVEITETGVDVPKEGQAFDITATVKGSDLNVAFDSDWIEYLGCDKDGDKLTMHFRAKENTGIPRTGVITVTTKNDKGESSSVDFTVKQAGSIQSVTVAEFLAAPESDVVMYDLVGTIGGTINTTYGNFDLTDATGTVYVYGLTATELGYGGKNDKSFASLGLNEGDVIKIRGYRGSYNGKEQVVYAWFLEKLASGPIHATVAEFNAAPESDTQIYELVGTIGGTINTTYGNFDLTDETGTVYVYGLTATELGYGAKNDKSFASLGLQEGDKIKIRGYRGSYGDKIEVLNAWFLEKMNVGPVVATVAEFNAAPESDSQVYELVGTIGGTINTTYGNFDLTDETGTVYVYGLTATELGYGAKNDKSFASLGLKEGDKIKIRGYRGSYGDKIEVLNAWFIEKLSSGPLAVTVAEFNAAPESDSQVYELVGTIGGSINTTYGNFDLTDETGTVYVYGLTATELGYGAKNDKSYASLGLKEGDKIKIRGYRGSYGDKIEVLNAWFLEKLESEPVVVTPSGASYTKVTSAPSDWSGTYLLVCDQDGINAAFSGFSGTIGSYITVTIDNGTIAGSADVDACQIVIAPATVTAGAYTIKFGDKFFAWNSGNALNNADEESAKANWNITYDTDHVVILNAETAVRNLQWNKNSPRFACYGNNNQTVVQLYKKADATN
ncbi:MAG: BACON domain-containing protein [Bacteroidales bacterium]|nr:BACON domain-containing protein [Bacteroidales bacterium]